MSSKLIIMRFQLHLKGTLTPVSVNRATGCVVGVVSETDVWLTASLNVCECEQTWLLLLTAGM